ncbi:Serine/threonine-protein kinase PknD [Aquisphaera giovannonii]|uniref:Serine/threonine-protein kinase PknD n=1 Tax=Aquisphaera giovannonii TaxID=406548 RepID=A0A5B9W9G2_9BACT|nr:serine/threonine-protein kinase [Aquisphaera giovannonii]QEH36904.1 Serine/threonine-protein kinase PknD [Aquisphaera giovannonii]
MADDAELQLLFGLLALQNGLIDRKQLRAAFRDWAKDGARPLADHLTGPGGIDADHRSLLEALLEFQLRRHDQDPGRCLAALDVSRSTREDLSRLRIPAIDATLSIVGSRTAPDDLATQSVAGSVGVATSRGQRFRVIRPHARGGLGAVFVALDSELNREVALKQILDDYADDPTSRARFLVEAEITGGLEHPGIVPVYGLGTYADGRPFYAMRFVQGDSLKEAIAAFHADEPRRRDPGRHSLELRKLLRRFIDVCNAIDYAHSRGVLHRDIKPGNVIVGRHGETLVVDWGLAKPIGRGPDGEGTGEECLVPSSASGSAETLPGSVVGTPAFMGPEQASGDLDRLGPASDVFGLGATLFCLLTGRPPIEGDSVAAMLRAARAAEFPAPRRIDPAIDRALEAVCLKAMAARPEDRYPTPRALAEDVERWMADSPVTAYREPAWQAARRWARRHRTAVAAGVAALLVSFAATAAVLAVQTKANNDLRVANSNLDAANRRERERFALAMGAIRLFHGEVSADLLLKEKQFDALRNKLLRGAAEFYGKIGRLLESQPDRSSRASLAGAYEELGDLTERIGDKPEALALLERAVEIRRELAAGPVAGLEGRVDLANSLVAVGKLREVTGDPTGAKSAFEEACSLAGYAGPSRPDSERRLAVDAVSQSALGWVLLRTGDPTAALARYRRALEDWRDLDRAHPGNDEYQSGRATSHDNIANALVEAGKHVEALAEYRESLAIRRELARTHPDAARFQSEVAHNFTGIGLLLSRFGKSDEELASYEQALAIERKLSDAYPAVTRFRSDVAWSLNNIAAVYNETGRQAEALETHRKALEIRRGLVSSHPRDTNFQRELASSHHNIGNVLSDTGRLDEAIVSYGEAANILERLVADNPAITQFRQALASTFHSLGGRHSELGGNAASLAALDRAVSLRRELAGAHPDVIEFRADLANSLNDLAGLLQRTGHTSRALKNYREARVIWDGLARSDPSVAWYRDGLSLVLINSGALLAAIGREPQALADLQEADRTYDALLKADPDNLELRSRFAWSRGELGTRLMLAGRDREAAPLLAMAMELKEAILKQQPDKPLDRYGLAAACRPLALLHERAGEIDACRRLLERGLAVGGRLASEAPRNPDYQELAASLETDLGRLALAGDRPEGLRLLRSALDRLDGLAEPSPECWYLKARVHSQMGKAAEEKPIGFTAMPDDECFAQLEAAIAWLRRAFMAGHRDRRRVASDRALDPVRNRPDFRLLALGLAFPEEPFAPDG